MSGRRQYGVLGERHAASAVTPGGPVRHQTTVREPCGERTLRQSLSAAREPSDSHQTAVREPCGERTLRQSLSAAREPSDSHQTAVREPCGERTLRQSLTGAREPCGGKPPTVTNRGTRTLWRENPPTVTPTGSIDSSRAPSVITQLPFVTLEWRGRCLAHRVRRTSIISTLW